MREFKTNIQRKAEFMEQAKKRNYEIISSFKNEHGEEFVLWVYPYMRENKIDMMFITGDEMGWESMVYYPRLNIIGNIFQATDNELKLAKEKWTRYKNNNESK